MNTRQILIGIILIITVGALVVWQHRETTTPVAMTATPTGTTQSSTQSLSDQDTPDLATTTTSGSGITAAAVAQHDTRESCWATINGNVYDLTSWIPHHPGGEQAILGLCGTDGSAKFNHQHGGSSRVLSVLAGFKIGIAAN